MFYAVANEVKDSPDVENHKERWYWFTSHLYEWGRTFAGGLGAGPRIVLMATLF